MEVPAAVVAAIPALIEVSRMTLEAIQALKNRVPEMVQYETVIMSVQEVLENALKNNFVNPKSITAIERAMNDLLAELEQVKVMH
jgi:hypothetical protein